MTTAARSTLFLTTEIHEGAQISRFERGEVEEFRNFHGIFNLLQIDKKKLMETVGNQEATNLALNWYGFGTWGAHMPRVIVL